MRQRDQADSVGAIGDYAFSAAVKDGESSAARCENGRCLSGGYCPSNKVKLAHAYSISAASAHFTDRHALS